MRSLAVSATRAAIKTCSMVSFGVGGGTSGSLSGGGSAKAARLRSNRPSPVAARKIGNRLVKKRQHLPHLVQAVVVVGLRPGGQHFSRVFRNRQPPGGIGGLGQLVERLRHSHGKRRVVEFSLRTEVVSRARGLCIAVRALPIDARGRQVDQMQRRVRRRGGRHRKHHAIADAGGLAVADERGAVGQKDAQQRHIVGRRGRSAAREQQRGCEPARQRSTVHEVSSVVRSETTVKTINARPLCKTC